MKDVEALNIMGSNLKKARLKKGFTQATLAEKCNISEKYVSCIELGKSSCSTSLIVQFCNILDITPDFLFGKTINNSNTTIDVLPNETAEIYLKLKPDNKKFVNTTIHHLYTMQIKR